MPNAKRPTRKTPRVFPPRALAGYRRLTGDPIYALLILVPLILTYEIGAILLRPAGAPMTRLIAPGAIRDLFAWLGATGTWLPALAMIAALAGMQFARTTASKPRFLVVVAMLCEGVVLAIPLILLSLALLGRTTPGGLSDGGITLFRTTLVLGAAIYEEFVFRLILMSALLFVFRDVMRVKAGPAAALSLAVAAAAFSACHFPPVGSFPFGWIEFFFYLSAGAYLSLLFLSRGLPIAVICHITYNIVLLAL